jgi:lysophospholipase L1-like esterase
MTRASWLTLGIGGLVAVCLIQALHLRRRTPRLAAPADIAWGTIHRDGMVIRVLVVGESSAAGVGVRTHRDGLAAQIAHTLAEQLNCSVQWHAVGTVGATAARTVNAMATLESLPNAEIAVLALGANDTLRMSSPVKWRRQLQHLVELLRARVNCRVVVLSPVPPLWSFRSLPVPLRGVWGAQAFVLDRLSRHLARQNRDVVYVSVPLPDQAAMLCEDRFHPSAAGYAFWGQRLAQAVASLPLLLGPDADLLVPERGWTRSRQQWSRAASQRAPDFA